MRTVIHILTVLAMVSAGAVSAKGATELDFGDDSGTYASDGECDDARFVGPGVSEYALVENIGKDATDCAEKFAAGDAKVSRYYDINGGQIDFGDDEGEYVNDGECDDVRFTGDYPDMVYIADDIGHDASDCRTLYKSGKVVWQGNLTQPET